MISAVTLDGVKAALKKPKREKAAGPDEINNNVYIGYAEALGPVLATFYTRWLMCSVFLASFGEANIQCLKKSASSAFPLDHRPIALLNSDYKIFTKVLSFLDAAIVFKSRFAGSSRFCFEEFNPFSS